MESDQKQILVELKIHRSPQIARRSIGNALLQLSRFMHEAGAEEGILVVTQRIDQKRIALPTGITLWDIQELVRRRRRFAQ